MTEHPITPSPELLKQWHDAWFETDRELSKPAYIAHHAAQWGADQELEACADWLANARNHSLSWNEATNFSGNLRNARRPKPPSLNSIAMQMLGTIERDGHYIPEITDTIRRALEQLPD